MADYSDHGTYNAAGVHWTGVRSGSEFDRGGRIEPTEGTITSTEAARLVQLLEDYGSLKDRELYDKLLKIKTHR